MRVPTKGSIADTTFIDILKDAATSNLTGMVRLENGTIIKVVYFQNGAIAFASSNEKIDRLTEVLKRAGKLTPEQVEDAQARLKPNVSLGKTLVELGYISARDLLWGARAQVEGVLHKLLFWAEGSYQILEGPLPKEIISLNLSVAQVIYEGILTIRDRQWLLDTIGSPEAVYALASDFHEKNAVYKLQADSVVSLMDGKRSLEEISQQSGLDTFETCKITAALKVLDLIEKAPEKPIQLEFPVEVPSSETEAEPAVEQLEPTVIQQVAPADVSLGQVLHVPTMDELQVNGKQASASAPTVVTEMPEVKTQPPVAQAAPTIVNPPLRTSPPKTATVGMTTSTSLSNPLEPPVFFKKRRHQKHHNTIAFLSEWSLNWGKILALAIILFGFGFGGWVYYRQSKPATDEPLTVTTVPAPEPPAPDAGKAAVSSPQAKPAESEPPIIQKEPAKPAPAEETPTPLTMARMGNLQQAAQLWKQKLSRNRTKFTVQLEIACQEKTVSDALLMMEYSQDILIIPMNFQGRSCYRVLYGIFPNISQGRAARKQLPSDFLNQPSPPQVVSIAKILQ